MDPMSFLLDSSACRANMLYLGNTDYLFRGEDSSGSQSSKRKSVFGFPEEMFGEKYYEEQLPERKCRLSSEQVYLLEKTFEAERKLEPEMKMDLAKKLGLQPRQVAIWFQNRRARWKTKQLERDYNHLKSSYNSLVIDYYSVLKDNEKLRSEVSSLNEKLQSRRAINGSHCLGQKSCIDPANGALMKVDDRHSSGSGGGGGSEVDEESPRLIDSSDSYFPGDDGHPQNLSLIALVKSEEYDSNADNRSCFRDMFGEQPGTIGWWSWP